MRRKFNLIAVAVLILVCCVPFSSCSPNVTGEEAEKKEVFRCLTGEINVSSNLVVASNETLFIETGAHLKFSGGAGIILQSGGSLCVFGSLDKPVVFTGTKGSVLSGGIRAGDHANIEIRHAVFESCGINTVSDKNLTSSAVIMCDSTAVCISNIEFRDSQVDSVIDLKSCGSNIDRIIITNSEVSAYVVKIIDDDDVLNEGGWISNFTLSGRITSTNENYDKPELFTPGLQIISLDASGLSSEVSLSCSVLRCSRLSRMDVSAESILNSQFESCNVKFNRSYFSIFNDCRFFSEWSEVDADAYDLIGSANTVFVSQEEFFSSRGEVASFGECYVRTEDAGFAKLSKEQLKGNWEIHKIHDNLFHVNLIRRH